MAQRKVCSDTASNKAGINYSMGPNVSQGGSEKTLASLSCPIDPYSQGKVFTVTNASVSIIEGANNLLSQNLKNTAITVDRYTKQTINLPGLTCEIKPNIPTKINFYGVEDFLNSGVKVIGIFPKFSNTISDDSTFIDWAYANEVEVDNPLLTHEPTLLDTGLTSLDIASHTSVKVDSKGVIYSGTLGGLSILNVNDSKIINTLNSTIISDYVTCLDIDSLDRVWVGTQGGVQLYSEGAYTAFSSLLNTTDKLTSVNVRDIKVIHDDLIAIATDLGMTIYTPSTSTSKFVQNYNYAQLLTNDIRCIAKIEGSTKICMGTDLGLYIFDYVEETFEFFNSSTSGWTAANAIQSLFVFKDIIYIGTYIGLVVKPLTGSTFTLTTSSAPNGPISSNGVSLFVSEGDLTNPDLLYMGHVQGLSVMNITNGQWSHYTHLAIPQLANRINSIYVVPTTLPNRNVFISTNIESVKLSGSVSYTYTSLPEVSANTQILYTYPSPGIQIAYNENFYLAFSKKIDLSVINSNVLIKDFSGLQVPGSWSYLSDNVASFTPTTPFTVGLKYTVSFTKGVRASDNSLIIMPENFFFYTEDLVPFFGWRTFGKINILSGSKDKKVESIYIRNPHFSDVVVDIILGN